jgi:hypothetical protein
MGDLVEEEFNVEDPVFKELTVWGGRREGRDEKG